MIQIAIEAAKAAGKILMEKHGHVESVKTKKDSTLVTEVDVACEEKIREIIGKKYPEHGFLGEEEGISHEDADYIWIIDPLDGTHNYIYGSHLFSVSIALAYKKEIIAGVVFLPVLNQLFTAEKGKGSFVNGKRLKVSDKRLSESLVSLGSKYLKSDSEDTQRVRKEISEKAFEVRITGCASYNVVSVATNVFSAWLSLRAKIWDVAAGKVIVEEAGGLVTDLEGKPITFDTTTFLATNKKSHEEILELLK